LSGKDELNVMSDEINTMLTMLSSAYQKDIMEGKKQLDYTLYHDADTQLPNKIYFNRIVLSQMALASDHEFRFAIGVINLKNFKVINDSFGHTAGAASLKQIAIRLQATLARPDFLARYSSDEFIFCIFEVDTADRLLESAKEILRVLEEPVVMDKKNVYFKIGLCFVLYPDDIRDLPDMQQKLGIATAAAKRTGESEIVIYNKSMHSNTEAKIILESNLRQAIANQELELFFQPKINLQTFTMAGVETLIRWRHPQYGLIPPSEFITAAEEIGLIKAIGSWSLHTACQKCVAWQRLGYKSFTMAVNASAAQFLQPGFVEDVRATLEKYQCPPELIEIELTESLLVGNIEFVIQRLAELGSIGVKIAIDDFGTGYSSLNYLKRLPIHYIKIDKSFIDGIPNDKNNAAICEAIMMLAKNLHLKIIAEGAENLSQLEFLAERHCDLIQGYIFSKPLEESDFVKLLELFKNNKEKEANFWRDKSTQAKS
jgi:diguanylate cyclase (GGDEF)-like protein